ncbi:type VII secretion target [Rhodococcus phenolicus]|uniref:type VII secretion target n=1 Tax=Rhodococcus phenolicus TaxID=263849 RepID=UPI0008323B4B|nr:type VII secretion target [Rhodococcus phenolicus]
MTGEFLQGGVQVRPETIAAFGCTAGDMAERMRGAVDEIHGGAPGQLDAGLGPIGAGFVAALVTAHGAHEQHVSRLVTALDGMAAVAAATAAGYDAHASEWSTRLRDAGATR